MHTLIFSFFKQVMDPTTILTEGSQGFEMSDHTTDHSWDTSDGLKEDKSSKVKVFGHLAWFVAREEVESDSKGLHDAIGKPVLDTLGLLVSDGDSLSIFEGPDGMSHTITVFIDDDLVFGDLPGIGEGSKAGSCSFADHFVERRGLVFKKDVLG